MIGCVSLAGALAASLFAFASDASADAGLSKENFSLKWSDRAYFTMEAPFPEGISFLPGAHYKTEVKSLPAQLRITDADGKIHASFAAPTNVAPPFTFHLALTGNSSPSIFTTKDGRTTLSYIGRLPKGFDPCRKEYMTTLRVRASGGAGEVTSSLSGGIGQADVRFVTRGRRGEPYIENGRLFFTFSARFYGSTCGVASIDASHPEKGCRFEGSIFSDYGDGRLRPNDIAMHIFYDEETKTWRGWSSNFSTGGSTPGMPGGRAKGGINAVLSEKSPLRGFSVVKAKPVGLDGMNEDPCGVWDGKAGKWRLLVSNFTPAGIRAQMYESDRWDGGFKAVTKPVKEDSTGTTIVPAGGSFLCLCGSVDRKYYIYSYPDLGMLGTMKLTPTPWGDLKGWPHGRGWPALAALPAGYPYRYLLLTMDRINFPGMPNPNWTYGRLYIYAVPRK